RYFQTRIGESDWLLTERLGRLQGTYGLNCELHSFASHSIRVGYGFPWLHTREVRVSERRSRLFSMRAFSLHLLSLLMEGDKNSLDTLIRYQGFSHPVLASILIPATRDCPL